MPVAAIELPLHMSYPFLVEDDGKVYCVPEMANADEIAIFRADEFPHRWSKAGVLVSGFAGVDPTVFRTTAAGGCCARAQASARTSSSGRGMR